MTDAHEQGPFGFDMRWLADRLDRMEGSVDERFDRMAEEIRTSRHGLREVVETIALQVASLVTIQAEHTRRIAETEGSARRKGERIASLERWRSFLAGAVAALMFLFPTTVAVILQVK